MIGRETNGRGSEALFHQELCCHARFAKDRLEILMNEGDFNSRKVKWRTSFCKNRKHVIIVVLSAGKSA